jgi:hypothetical protein
MSAHAQKYPGAMRAGDAAESGRQQRAVHISSPWPAVFAGAATSMCLTGGAALSSSSIGRVDLVDESGVFARTELPLPERLKTKLLSPYEIAIYRSLA